MRWTWIFAMVFGLTLGCESHLVAEADPVPPSLGESFVLAGGQEATMKDGDLHLRFTEVLEDSRCPKRVECVWTGEARIALLVQSDGSNPTTVQFNTNPAPGQNVQTAKVDGYTIALLSLDPYPQTIEESIPLEEYSATLSVRRD